MTDEKKRLQDGLKSATARGDKAAVAGLRYVIAFEQAADELENDGFEKGGIMSLPAFVVPGQVPRRSSIPSLDSLTQMPGPVDRSRIEMAPVLRPQGLTKGLIHDTTVAEKFQNFVKSTMETSTNEMQFRASLMHHMMHDLKADPILRRTLLERSLSFYRTTMKKSMEPTMVDEIEKAEPRGGSYHRRVTGEDGKHRYYYSEDDYAKRPDAHVSGPEVKKAKAKKAVLDHVTSCGDKGCDVDALKGLSEKHDPEHITDAVREHVKAGRLKHEGGKLKAAGDVAVFQKSGDLHEWLAKAAGEGTRGGKVIGHTSSGKPIYAPGADYHAKVAAMRGASGSSFEHAKNEKDDHEIAHASSHSFTPAEHHEAAQVHNRLASEHHGTDEGYAHAQMYAAHKNVGNQKRFQNGGSMQKSEGEGSRGGKIIGHTSTGKPIYATSGGASAHATNPHFSSDDHTEIAQQYRAHVEKLKAAGAHEKAEMMTKKADSHEAAAKLKGKDPSTSLVSAHAKMKANRALGRPDFATAAKVDKGIASHTGGERTPEEHKAAAEWHRNEAKRSLDRKSGKHPESWHGARRADRAELHNLLADAHERHAGVQKSFQNMEHPVKKSGPDIDGTDGIPNAEEKDISDDANGGTETKLSVDVNAGSDDAASKAALEKGGLHAWLGKAFGDPPEPKDAGEKADEAEAAKDEAENAPEPDDEEPVEKAEGARGGHVIGHTSSGKPIYQTDRAGNVAGHEGYSKQDHADAARVHDRNAQHVAGVHPELHAQHKKAADAHSQMAKQFDPTKHAKALGDAANVATNRNHGHDEASNLHGQAANAHRDAAKQGGPLQGYHEERAAYHEQKQKLHADSASQGKKPGAFPAPMPHATAPFLTKKSMGGTMATPMHDWLKKSAIPGVDVSTGEGSINDSLVDTAGDDLDEREAVNGPGLDLDGHGKETMGMPAGNTSAQATIGALDTGKTETLNEDDPAPGEMNGDDVGINAKPAGGPADLGKSTKFLPHEPNVVARPARRWGAAVPPADVVHAPAVAQQAARAAPAAVNPTLIQKGMTVYSDGTDLAVERFQKSAEGFYADGAGPSLSTLGAPIQKSMACGSCGGTMPAFLTKCPSCGNGQLAKSNVAMGPPPRFKPAVVRDLHLPNGTKKG